MGCLAGDEAAQLARRGTGGESGQVKAKKNAPLSFLFFRFLCCHFFSFSLFVWISVSPEEENTRVLELQVK